MFRGSKLGDIVLHDIAVEDMHSHVNCLTPSNLFIYSNKEKLWSFVLKFLAKPQGMFVIVRLTEKLD